MSLGSERIEEPEAELVRQAQERTSEGYHTPRSAAAFETLYCRFLSGVTTYVLRKMKGDTDAAADVVSCTFTAAWNGLPAWKPKPDSPAPFRGWLFKIAENEIKQYYRDMLRPTKARFSPAWIFGKSLPSPADPEEQECLQRVLAALGEEERDVLLLVHEQGFKPKEVPQQLARPRKKKASARELTVRQVYNILARAEMKFTAIYQKECGD